MGLWRTVAACGRCQQRALVLANRAASRQILCREEPERGLPPVPDCRVLGAQEPPDLDGSCACAVLQPGGDGSPEPPQLQRRRVLVDCPREVHVGAGRKALRAALDPLPALAGGAGVDGHSLATQRLMVLELRGLLGERQRRCRGSVGIIEGGAPVLGAVVEQQLAAWADSRCGGERGSGAPVRWGVGPLAIGSVESTSACTWPPTIVVTTVTLAGL
eukprot:COSAG04_NODE_7128_length_1185_cov_1.054328_1_plen_216_part_10